MVHLPRRYTLFKKPKWSFPFRRFVLPWNGDYFLMHDPNALKIYIDGSAYRNPGHEGGLAGIAEFPESLSREPEIIFEESYRETTNNRMDLRACIRALRYIRENARRLRLTRAIILTDSQYVNE